jgi:hypothetical protein
MNKLSKDDFKSTIDLLDNDRSLNKFIDNVNTVLENGEAIKADFDKVKDHGNKLVENIWKTKIHKQMVLAFQREKTKEENFMYYEINNLYAHSVDGIIKKVSNPKNIDQSAPIVKAAKEIFPDLKFISDTLKHVKSLITVKRKALVEKDNKEDETNKKYLSHKDIITCRENLKSFIVDIKDELESNQFNYISEIAERIKNEITELNGNRRKLYNIYSGDPSTREIYDLVSKKESTYRMNEPVTLEEDSKIKDGIQILSKRKTSDIIDFFISRATEKVAPILFNKNNLDQISHSSYYIRNGILETNLSFSFKDNSKFNLNSQVEYASSKLGKLFLRFPSRFNTVVMPSGNTMKSPSEKNMHDVFLKENALKTKKQKLI